VKCELHSPLVYIAVGSVLNTYVLPEKYRLPLLKSVFSAMVVNGVIENMCDVTSFLNSRHHLA